ncbi:glycosyltransferase [Nocardioides hwasunensis]|uniref:Glycosyltransferase n=1 Tax=Nocardioides hwasunensis TaxID=397258 RepID=A0ABR8MKT5_9ACTN|nr:glycosyltransferase [Nocardioides hwasunensis]MBD3916643.1 glycosyltransferase [Nocardioides hwasunensis]
MTEVLYVSSVPTAAQFQWMKDMRLPDAQEVTYGMPEAGFKFHTLIQDGLIRSGARVTSLVGRSATSAYYRAGWWRREVERVGPDHVVDHRGFPNRRVLKQTWLAGSLAVAALRWRVRTRRSDERVLIVDAAYVSALPGVLLATWGGGISRVVIVADIYGFMADVSDATDRSPLIYRALRRVVAATYRGVDGFVLLTEQMNEVVNRRRRPFLVMEGLVDHKMTAADNALGGKVRHPTVLYAGALRREYGVETLVEGFREVEDPDARLVIYGAGDFAPDLVLAAAEDPRIDFRGPAPIETVLRAEESAWLLVNPRPADAEFTKYSFPSKNMEYLASGTPVLTTRLPGMPQEYYDFVLTIDGSSPHDVAAALRSALTMTPEELHLRGGRGKSFVMERKNNVAQARRILDFAEKCR